MILFLDTNIVIYSIEQNPVFGPKVVTRLAIARAAGDTIMISDLTRMECLVLPLRLGNVAVQQTYSGILRLDDRRTDHASRLRPGSAAFGP